MPTFAQLVRFTLHAMPFNVLDVQAMRTRRAHRGRRWTISSRGSSRCSASWGWADRPGGGRAGGPEVAAWALEVAVAQAEALGRAVRRS